MIRGTFVISSPDLVHVERETYMIAKDPRRQADKAPWSISRTTTLLSISSTQGAQRAHRREESRLPCHRQAGERVTIIAWRDSLPFATNVPH